MKQYEFVVRVEPQFNMTNKTLQEKLKRWIEHYGHTASSFGFEFISVRKIGDDE